MPKISLGTSKFRWEMIEDYTNLLLEICTKKELTEILKDPETPFNKTFHKRVAHWHGIQPRTSKEIILSAQWQIWRSVQREESELTMQR